MSPDERTGRRPPPGYLGADARIDAGPAPELVRAGYALELADAALLHRGLTLADLAHTLVLAEQGLVPGDRARLLLATLLELAEVPADEFPYDERYGDAYNSRERELARRIGDAAGWLHLGRTRREAGRIAFRLVLRDRLLGLAGAVEDLLAALADRAEETAEAVWADMTYLQPAQPSTFGHYLASFAEEAARHLDRIRLAHAWADTSPAGSGGVAGTRLGLDRRGLADLLGLDAVGPNTRDTMWNLDGVVDAVAAATQAALTADRLAEDLQIMTSPGLALVELDGSLCRASVLMPQKRNPYALAVVRAGASTLVGRLTGTVTTARTPSAQTDNWLHTYGETPGALGLATRVLSLTAAVVRTLRIDTAALAATAASPAVAATDLADELAVRGGLDYRTAYRVVGRAVATALSAAGTAEPPRPDLAALREAAREVTGDDLPAAVLDDGGWLAQALDPRAVVATRREPGGCGPDRLREELAALRARLDAATRWRRARQDAAAGAETALLAKARAVAGAT